MISVLEQGKGPAVIYLHGIGGRADSFAAQLASVSGFRNIAWNMPGYGSSQAHSGDLSFATLSDCLSGLMQQHDIQSAHLVGHSIGGMLAIDHAIRKPDQVTSLTLIGTTPAFGSRDPQFAKAFLKARLTPLDAGQSMKDMAKQAAPHLVGPRATVEVIDDIQGQLSAVPPQVWRQILKCLVTFNRRDVLHKITQPCCLIAGSHDTNAPAKTMHKMADVLPNATYHLLDGIGHMIPQEAALDVNAILQQFLESVSDD